MRNYVKLGVLLFMGGTLGLLGVCAVAKVRDAAARMSCSHNLKQVGLALHGYRDTHGCFPAADEPYPEVPPAERLGWTVAIVPYLE